MPTTQDPDFCDSLEDVPPMGTYGFIQRPYLILPPYNWDWISAAYDAAAWRWCMDTDDRKEFWRTREQPESIQAYLMEMEHAVIPSPRRCKHDAERLFDDVRHRKEGVSQCGGMLIFLSKSGRIGLGLDEVLGEHYLRIKTAAMSAEQSRSCQCLMELESDQGVDICGICDKPKKP